MIRQQHLLRQKLQYSPTNFTMLDFISVKKMIGAFIFLFFFYGITTAQVLEIYDTQDPPYTVENLITNVFLGEGVEITDIQFDGAESSVGYFQKALADVGIERGIVLTTGNAKSRNASLGADNPASVNSDDDNGSNTTDSDITDLATAGVFNLSKYEITFVPVADTLRFKYVFASEEYPEFTCAIFNDIFGFFITGPNPAGGMYNSQNIALVPDSNLPVTINNVHSTNPEDAACAPINEEFYNDNTGSMSLVYDAYLDVFIAEAVVVPCEEYTIKLAIADLGDPQYDSAVFLEAKSFGTGTIQVEAVTVSVDGSIVEGCADAEVSFVLPYTATSDYIVEFDVLGTAQNGVDYDNVPANITIPAGSNMASIVISANEDNTAEPIETVGIDIQRDICNRDTFWINIRDKVIVPPNLEDTIALCGNMMAADLDATLNVTIPPPPQFNNSTNTIIFHPPNQTPVQPIISSIEVSGVAPVQLGPETIKSVCIDTLRHPWIDDLDIYLVSPSGLFIELTTDNGGDGGNGAGEDFYLNTCFTPTATQDIKFGNPIAALPEHVPFTGDFQPEGYFSDLWFGNNPTNGTWSLYIIDDTPTAIGELLSWSICFNNTYDIAYEWTPSAGLSCTDCASPTAAPNTTTTYTVTATDTYGCVVTDMVTIVVPETLATPTIVCDDNVVGEITFSWDEVEGATAYEVNVNGTGWGSPNQAPLEHFVNGLGLGESVSIEVRSLDDCGQGPSATLNCSAIDCIAPTASINNLQAVSCPGLTDGQVTIETNGGNPPFTFILGTETNTTGVFTNLESNTYTVEVADELSCSTFIEFTIEAPIAIASNPIIVTPIGCANANTGAVTLAVTGGTGPYTFNWDNAVTDSIYTNLAAGNFMVTILDANNCTHSSMVTLDNPMPIQVSEAIVPVACYEGNTGSIAVIPSGGNGPYTYTWEDNSTDSLHTDLTAGSYTVLITDMAGCTTQSTYILDEPTPFIVDAVATPASCFNTLDGSAIATASNGQVGATIDFLWDTGDTGEMVDNLSPGDYTVIASDANGCSASETITISSPPAIELQASANAISCFGLNDGTAMAMASGGTGALTYAWENGNTQASINNLTEGTYMVSVTDENACEATETITITAPSAISLTANTTPVDCNGGENGTIDLNVTGGTGTYNYDWNTTANSEDLANLSEGTYTVLVTDNNDCTAEESFDITQSTVLTSVYDVTEVNCFGESTGSIISSINGGALPYSYEWSNGTITPSLQYIEGGTYYLTITDANNCTSMDSVLVNEPSQFITGAITQTPINCHTSNDATILIEAMGGTTPYLYSINGENFSTNNSFVGLPPNDYIIFIEDANGCIASLPNSIVIEQPAAVSVELGENLFIPLGEEFSLNPVIQNTVGTVDYNWETSDPSTLSCLDCFTPTVSTPESTTYELTITDENGCSATDLITVFINKQIEILVPTGFTPNNDNLNDELLVHGKTDKIEEVILFRVFDRWGELVFEQRNFDVNETTVGWNGKFHDKDMPTGVYVWYIEVLSIDGKTKSFKGETTLIR